MRAYVCDTLTHSLARSLCTAGFDTTRELKPDHLSRSEGRARSVAAYLIQRERRRRRRVGRSVARSVGRAPGDRRGNRGRREGSVASKVAHEGERERRTARRWEGSE